MKRLYFLLPIVFYACSAAKKVYYFNDTIGSAQETKRLSIATNASLAEPILNAYTRVLSNSYTQEKTVRSPYAHVSASLSKSILQLPVVRSVHNNKVRYSEPFQEKITEGKRTMKEEHTHNGAFAIVGFLCDRCTSAFLMATLCCRIYS